MPADPVIVGCVAWNIASSAARPETRSEVASGMATSAGPRVWPAHHGRSGMAIFNKDVIKLAETNKDFQKEVYYDEQCQITVMTLQPGEDIGEETHEADQTTFFVSGEGQAVVDGKRTKVSANHLVVIPKGALHNIVNKGEEPLKLFTIYSPPAEEQGVHFKTKAEHEAHEAEEG
jgi:mannose-6-phosphate isomerase-like protein (cupin superfamily)